MADKHSLHPVELVSRGEDSVNMYTNHCKFRTGSIP